MQLKQVAMNLIANSIEEMIVISHSGLYCGELGTHPLQEKAPIFLWS
jgi:hypothetical protein